MKARLASSRLFRRTFGFFEVVGEGAAGFTVSGFICGLKGFLFRGDTGSWTIGLTGCKSPGIVSMFSGDSSNSGNTSSNTS